CAAQGASRKRERRMRRPSLTLPARLARIIRQSNGTLMLPRVLEPEVMDSAEEAGDYDAMDHAQVNRVFVADFLAVWDGRGPVLDVGTGTAQIPIELCRQAAGVEVVGVDLAEHMLAVGRANVRREGFEPR